MARGAVLTPLLALAVSSSLAALPVRAEPPRCQVQGCPKDLSDARHTVTYADGSGNQFVLHAGVLEYVPVKREQSSSGLYDGGPSWKATLTPAQYAAIAQAIDRAIATPAAHAPRRAKMTGLIELRCGAERASWILSARTAELKAVEDALGQARPKP